MTEQVHIQTRDPQPVVNMRSTILVKDLGPVFGERVEALNGYLRRHGVEPVGPPFVRYHTFGEHETDVETGVPLAAVPEGPDGDLHPGLLPGGTLLSTSHEGPDQELGQAYARIASAVRDGGYTAAGPAWEVYHWLDLGTGPATDPGPRRIELVQPVEAVARGGTAPAGRG